MIPIEPKTELFLLPPGAKRVVYAADQPEYIPLPSIRTSDGRVATQWQLEPNDIELLRNGAPITLVLHTFGLPLQPIQLAVGGMDLR